jgi:hypothetical protein
VACHQSDGAEHQQSGRPAKAYRLRRAILNAAVATRKSLPTGRLKGHSERGAITVEARPACTGVQSVKRDSGPSAGRKSSKVEVSASDDACTQVGVGGGT